MIMKLKVVHAFIRVIASMPIMIAQGPLSVSCGISQLVMAKTKSQQKTHTEIRPHEKMVQQPLEHHSNK